MHLRCLDASMLIATSNYRLTRGTANPPPSHLHQTFLVVHQLEVEHSARKPQKYILLTYRQTFSGISSECLIPFSCVVVASILFQFPQVLKANYEVQLVSKYYISPTLQPYSKYVMDVHNRDECNTHLFNQAKDARVGSTIYTVESLAFSSMA